MKIILAHYKYYIQGGPERYMFKFMELAKQHGCEVIPFSVNFPTNTETEYSKYFVGKDNAGGNFDANNRSISYLLEGAYHEFHNREAYQGIKKLIRDVKPDLLYTLIPGQLTPDIFKAAKEEGIPVIHRISDFRLICGKYTMLRGDDVCDECMHGNYKAMIGHRCIKGSKALSALRAVSCYYHRIFHTYENVDAVITPPANTKRLLVESGFFPESKVHVNPTFIDCNGIEPCYEHDDYVLCLGRFSEEKGFKYVVEAMKHLKDIPVKIAITGDESNCPESVMQFIHENSLEEKIKFVGFIKGKELEEIIRRAMCVACPAIWYENMPNVVLEAFAYGKPVIASNLGSLADMVENGENGLLFEPKNAEQIASCIRQMYTGKEKYTHMSMQARKTAEDVYSPERHWEKFMQIYEMIRGTK